jgi:hypothetical protein
LTSARAHRIEQRLSTPDYKRQPGCPIHCAVVSRNEWESTKKLKRPGDAQLGKRRYYDFNVGGNGETEEKLAYMHRNPVKRGFVARPEDWRWSSFHHYATGEAETVEIESFWAASRREQAAPASATMRAAGHAIPASCP